MKCQLCEKTEAEFGLYATFGTIKECRIELKFWLELCDKCDKIVGEANLEKYYRDMPLTDGRLVGEC